MGVYAHKTRENPGKRLDFRKKLGIPGKKICLCPIVQTNQTDFHTSGRDPHLLQNPVPKSGIHVVQKPDPESGVRTAGSLGL